MSKAFVEHSSILDIREFRDTVINRTVSKGRIIFSHYYTKDYSCDYVLEINAKKGRLYLCNSTNNKRLLSHEINITSTICNYGGLRYFFICPLCHSNKGMKLYKPNGNKYYGCRKCYNLAYYSQNYSGNYRYLNGVIIKQKRIEKVRATVKREVYGGKPTKAVQKIAKYMQEHGDDNMKALRLIKSLL